MQIPIKNKNIYNITFDKSFKFYYVKGPNNDYVLAVKVINKNVIYKYKISLSGNIISDIKDIISNDNTLI